MEFGLNSSVNVTIPENWTGTFTKLIIENLSNNGTLTNCSEVNLIAEHNGTSHSFGNLSKSVTFESPSLKNTEHLVFNLTSNKTNGACKCNISLFQEISLDTQFYWTSNQEEYRYNITIPLVPPSKNLTNPLLKIYIPDQNYSSLNATIRETGVQIPSYHIDEKNIDKGYLTIDLIAVEGIGNQWNNDDDPFHLDLNLTYTLSNIRLDIGNNGETDYSFTGVFNNTSVVINTGCCKNPNEK